MGVPGLQVGVCLGQREAACPRSPLRVAGRRDTGLAPNSSQKEDTGLGSRGLMQTQFIPGTGDPLDAGVLPCSGQAWTSQAVLRQLGGPSHTTLDQPSISSLLKSGAAVLRNCSWTSAWVAPKSVPRIAPGLMLRGCSLISAQGSSCTCVQIQCSNTGSILRDAPSFVLKRCSNISAQGCSGISALGVLRHQC